MSNLRVRAVVSVTVEVTLPSHWGGDVTADTLHPIACREGIDHLTRALTHAGRDAGFRITGTPKVTHVITEIEP